MMQIYPVSGSPELTQLDYALPTSPQLGSTFVDLRLAAAEWLPTYLHNQWEILEDDDNAYAGSARILILAAVTQTADPADLAYASGLPSIFVRLVLSAFAQANWREDVLPELMDAVATRNTVLIKEFVDEFMICDFRVDERWPELFDVIAPDLRGVGRTNFQQHANS